MFAGKLADNCIMIWCERCGHAEFSEIEKWRYPDAVSIREFGMFQDWMYAHAVEHLQDDWLKLGYGFILDN